MSPFKTNRKADPSYDDFMNSVFNNKTHKSYFLREKADLRSEILKDKFMNGLNKGAADEQRIQNEYEKKVRETSQQLEERMKNR